MQCFPRSKCDLSVWPYLSYTSRIDTAYDGFSVTSAEGSGRIWCCAILSGFSDARYVSGRFL